eukprot:3620058-Rhodomonas_salina.1
MGAISLRIVSLKTCVRAATWFWNSDLRLSSCFSWAMVLSASWVSACPSLAAGDPTGVFDVAAAPASVFVSFTGVLAAPWLACVTVVFAL